jgi:hypothetical protein
MQSAKAEGMPHGAAGLPEGEARADITVAGGARLGAIPARRASARQVRAIPK